MIYRQQPAHQPSNHQRTCPHPRHVTRHRHAHSLSIIIIIIFICPIIQQYAAHLRQYDSRTAGQQGPIRTLTASSSYIRAFRSCLVRQQIHAQRYRAVAPTPRRHTVSSFLRPLQTCHCPHMLRRRRPCSNRSTSPTRRAHSSKPAARCRSGNWQLSSTSTIAVVIITQSISAHAARQSLTVTTNALCTVHPTHSAY